MERTDKNTRLDILKIFYFHFFIHVFVSAQSTAQEL